MATTNLPHYTDREHARHPTPIAGDEAVKATVEIDTIEIHGILANISRFGACVAAPQELALMALPRTVLTLRATLGTETVSMTADLCWIHNEVGKTTIGMSFPYGPLESGTFLDAYMEGGSAAAA
ncbi:PilZ domain-containing protein [Cyanobium sp. FGCU-52]|nr:PilZ domain-containing protein [Cyanobium sp. FGCU52]